MSDRLYALAQEQAEVSERYGRQARQECSTEDAIAIITDYVRVTDERLECGKLVSELNQDGRKLREKLARMAGEKGALQRKVNSLEKQIGSYNVASNQQEELISKHLDTIHELTAQLDARDVQ